MTEKTGGVTRLQTGCEKRVWKLLILKGSFAEVPPPRVFCKKRLQAVENKGGGSKKERKEAARD
jgi:hypothetical protein